MLRTLTSLLLTVLFVSACAPSHAGQPVGEGQADTLCVTPPDSSLHLSLLLAGDLMQHDAQIQTALRPDGSYDYTQCFERIRPEVERADVAIANLEVTLGGRPYKGYPCFSAPDEYLTAIQQAGFDVLITANNHCCDKGKRGLGRTLQLCDSIGMPHFGTYRDSTERQRTYPFLLERGGFRIALLAYTYGTNGLKVPDPFVVNLIDTTQIAADIRKARQMHPDVIIAFEHWGIEYELHPRKHMERLAQWLLDHGVDHVIGGHPHVVQPLEFREDSVTGSQHLVAYSLGNLLSDQTTFPRYGGMMVRLEFAKAGPSSPARVTDCGYTLHFVSLPRWNHRQHRITPVAFPDSLLNSTERLKRDLFLKTARPLFEECNVGIREYTY